MTIRRPLVNIAGLTQELPTADILSDTVTSNSHIGRQVVSTVSTVGATTFTAAQFVGGYIVRTGSTATYSDTTPTATAIIAAIPSAVVGTSFTLTIRNTVAFIETILAGTGVTLAQTTAVAASTARNYVGVITNIATPAITLTGISSGPL